MLFNDIYKTINKPSEGMFSDKGSKFMAYAFPVKAEDEIKELLSQIKTEHSKARHFCWALRLSPDRSVFRLNDDGEPSGTAGRPILNTLLSFDITDVFVVVVRYFGGTLLGVPGLINAYKTATVDALKNAEIIERTLNDFYLIKFDYLQMNKVMRIIKDENLNFSNQLFDNNCSVEIEIRKIHVNQVIGKFGKIENISLTYLRTC